MKIFYHSFYIYMMSVSKFLKMMEQNKLVIIGIFLVLAFVFFAPKKNLFTSPMTNDASSKVKSETDSNEWESKPRTLWSEMSPGVISQAHAGATGVSSKPPSAAEPDCPRCCFRSADRYAARDPCWRGTPGCAPWPDCCHFAHQIPRVTRSESAPPHPRADAFP